MDADVIVVGAGLAGLVAAAEIADAGHRVLLLDQEGEQSLAAQAHWSLGGLFLVDSPEQRRFTRAMQRFPSVVRTQYASALLAERDPGKAAALRARFEQLAPDYPRPIELVGELELMDHVDSLVGQ